MNLARWNLVLFVILLALVGLDLGWRLSKPAPREVTRLFPELWPDQAQRVLIEASRPADEQRRIELTRRGESWILPGQAGMPARMTRLRSLLERLSSLTDLDRIAEDAARHAEYGVDEGGTVVRVFGAEDELLAALIQGKEPPALPGDSFASTWVRPLGDDAVYRAARFPIIELETLDWMDNRWLDFDPASVRALTLTIAGAEPLMIERSEDGGWVSPDGRGLSKTLVQELLVHARGLFFESVADPADGEVSKEADEVELQLLLEFELEASIDVAISTADIDGVRWSWKQAQPWRVRFAAAMVEPLIRRGRELGARLQ